CRTELKALGGVRQQLARWNPPEPQIQPSAAGHQSAGDTRWWKQVPAWAQVAAALLFLGVSAGVANLDVHYGSNGLSVRTGWMAAPANDAGARTASTAVTHDELVSLEQHLRSEMRPAASVPTVDARPAADDGRTRAMIAESERRQKSEFALQLAKVVREFESERQGDLVTIDHNLSVLWGGTMTVDQQQRALTNYVATRFSQQR
ncbi:MAG TPA: hypothetical protein VEU08_13350, partial [Vicinamibacterales bacterium]|nr:hypothetical protein [Vicinamibacterales bacterium]